MGWGEPHRPIIKPEVAEAANRMAAAIRAWNLNRSLKNEEAMRRALIYYDMVTSV